RRKSNEAKSRKAAALLIIVDDFQKRYSQNKKYISGATLQLDEEPAKKEAPSMPVLYISREMADQLLKEGKQKKTIDEMISKISKKKSPQHIEFKLEVGIDIQRKSERLNSENVLGYIEGTDLKNELVIVTAHMDHLGIDTTKTGDQVFNGADDDGSGTVSVIEMAEAFAKAKKGGHGPRRSILFMCVTGEEKGLLGSRWYTDHPVFPLANTVVDLNIDMIGRVDPAHEKDTNYVYVIGSDKLSSELKVINENNNSTYTKMALDYRYDVPNEPNNFYGRSDHYNFAKNNIPIAFFFNGVHADYHKETDEVSKINFPLMARRAQLVFYDAWEIANRDQRLVVDAKKSK
ncbi:MAG TPA: M28 family peptidase, partial [Bacteroidia bacterium]|nr:M28 family peptidase [Bacteroidia bacterium]